MEQWKDLFSSRYNHRTWAVSPTSHLFGECLGIVWPHDFLKFLPQQVCKWDQVKGEQVEQRFTASPLPAKHTQCAVPSMHSEKGSKPDRALVLHILNVETAFWEIAMLPLLYCRAVKIISASAIITWRREENYVIKCLLHNWVCLLITRKGHVAGK